MPPHWSDEEDAAIEAALRTATPYDAAAHNARFQTDRTPVAFKARMAKIRKVIATPTAPSTPSTPSTPTTPSTPSTPTTPSTPSPSHHWSDEERHRLVDAVKANPIHPQWERLATEFNRSEAGLKLIYYAAVTPEEHVTLCLKDLTPHIIEQIMEEYRSQCYHCKGTYYTDLYRWKDQEYCEECHAALFAACIAERWVSVEAYARQKGMDRCNLCQKQAPLSATGFHYDHIDMFEKEGSICRMVKDGDDLHAIYEEIDRCQRLCTSCHRMVTKIEHACGLVRMKREMKKNGMEMEQACKYRMCMTQAYDVIRATQAKNKNITLATQQPQQP
jgi:hypothetical protein